MNHRYIYLISIVVLTLPALLDEWIIGRKKLRPYWRILVAVSLIGLVYGFTESFALRWAMWTFDINRNLDIWLFGAHLETYLINILAFAAVGSATLLLISAHHKVIGKRR